MLQLHMIFLPKLIKNYQHVISTLGKQFNHNFLAFLHLPFPSFNLLFSENASLGGASPLWACAPVASLCSTFFGILA